MFSAQRYLSQDSGRDNSPRTVRETLLPKPLYLPLSPGAGTHGFTLVEIVLALGLFAFAIVPIIGLVGVGLNLSKESAEASALANIYRQAGAHLAEDVSSNAMDSLYFTYSAEETIAGDPAVIYRLNFQNVVPSDAARGLMARKLWKLTIVRADTPNVPLDEHFVVLNKDPVDVQAQFD